ncbi:MAG: hypothetical protein A2Y17_04625 [Clostridiales bacterium GWF2_38_85]|nr:MAG: hypothetical protein A2Y17_04625 [Clostridiales bacterium GWF2_38_85]HBL84428.1 hypothetical protein [Clostridiales bacterium]
MLEQYYNEQCNEDGRLQLDRANTIEYQTTLHFLLTHLPKGCSVLDCCAGTGVYAFPLADNGYTVTAGDLMQKHVDIMRSKDTDRLLTKIYQGDVLDMSAFEENSFDAVICMGALYHLQTQAEREKCIGECLRVLKVGGAFTFSYINRNACFINHFNRADIDIAKCKTILDTGNNGVFYAMNFDESDLLANEYKVEKITNIGVDGLRYPLREIINSCSDQQFEAYMEYHLATCEQPSIIGHSMHGLWIGRKS